MKKRKSRGPRTHLKVTHRVLDAEVGPYSWIGSQCKRTNTRLTTDKTEVDCLLCLEHIAPYDRKKRKVTWYK